VQIRIILNKGRLTKAKVLIKNTAMGSFEIIPIEQQLTLLRFQNEADQVVSYEHPVPLGMIQFHFGIKGKGKFLFNQGSYTLELREEASLLLYNPQKELPLHLELEPGAWAISMLVSLKKLHNLFSADSDYFPFLTAENRDKKYYKEDRISPSMAIVLNQLFHYHLHQSIKALYYKGKSYELLSLFFNRNDDPNAAQCPFLIDEENVLKIKRAKQIMIENMAEPPSLEALAEQIGLPLKKLKMGFKQIYGDTVYGFLFDYKMEYARRLLDSGSYNVNEAGLKVGYSTGSHFIAAFKKKFGTTPKKYILSLNVAGN
jgi:AraC-like DNA-binding protein